VSGYFGPYRLLLADLVVVTMAEEPFGSASRVASLIARIRDVLATVHDEGAPEVQVVRTVFRPAPTRSLADASVCVATTAPSSVGESISRHLEKEEGCRVVGITHALSNRAQLERELDDIMPRADVLVCEIKAAGIDVATKKAMDAGLEVVYMNNVPTGVEGDDPAAAFNKVARIATDRFAERT
jgi:cyclic 2,3-diphosphoglycerate synthetase